MAIKTERIEARLSTDERALIERAAVTSGTSVSAFLVRAAVDRADEIIATSKATVVPVDYFDRLLAALDEPDVTPRLAEVATRVLQNARITAR